METGVSIESPIGALSTIEEGGDEVFWCGSNTHYCQHGGDRENVFHCCIHR